MDLIMQQSIAVVTSTPVKPKQEQTLFLQMNYCRDQLCKVRRRLLKSSRWAGKDLQELLLWYNKQQKCRSDIVTCNMGLVLSMARRVKYPGIEFTDLMSEGSMALLRATEKFDCARGFKFSTYACRAILKSLARVAQQTYRYNKLFPAQLDTTLENGDNADQQHKELQKDLVDEFQVIMDKNLADLSEVEKSVLKMRFSLDSNRPSPLTLKKAGQRLGLTKERVRQIQNKALAKLRPVAEERLVPV
jgi:RNA polymerase sigma factor (sigma-70 family)